MFTVNSSPFSSALPSKKIDDQSNNHFICSLSKECSGVYSDRMANNIINFIINNYRKQIVLLIS